MPISRFELIAQRFVEGSFRRLLSDTPVLNEMLACLVEAAEESRSAGKVAGSYTVYLHPRDLDALVRRRGAPEEVLSSRLSQFARQAGWMIASRPQVDVQPDPSLRRGEAQAIAAPRSEPEQTQVYRPIDQFETALAGLKALAAYLVVEGRRHFPLERPLVTIGRHVDNDLVLDVPSVSRRHAQLQLRHGRFVLYDVSRRGRTAVNGQNTLEYVLQDGDVIALGDALLIYGVGRDERAALGSRPAGQDAPTRPRPRTP
ncbi:MAG: FhaA domain-containing protein [Anaerolineae bacterium]